jgi:hypothetical protein
MKRYVDQTPRDHCTGTGSKTESTQILKVAFLFAKAKLAGKDPYRATDGTSSRLVVVHSGRKLGQVISKFLESSSSCFHRG